MLQLIVFFHFILQTLDLDKTELCRNHQVGLFRNIMK